MYQRMVEVGAFLAAKETRIMRADPHDHCIARAKFNVTLSIKARARLVIGVDSEPHLSGIRQHERTSQRQVRADRGQNEVSHFRMEYRAARGE
jgi:hypothetical protein